MRLYVLLDTKEDILLNDILAPLTSIVREKYGSQWCPTTIWLSKYLKKLSFVFSSKKKGMQVWNKLRMSKL